MQMRSALIWYILVRREWEWVAGSELLLLRESCDYIYSSALHTNRVWNIITTLSLNNFGVWQMLLGRSVGWLIENNTRINMAFPYIILHESITPAQCMFSMTYSVHSPIFPIAIGRFVCVRRAKYECIETGAPTDIVPLAMFHTCFVVFVENSISVSANHRFM